MSTYELVALTIGLDMKVMLSSSFSDLHKEGLVTDNPCYYGIVLSSCEGCRDTEVLNVIWTTEEAPVPALELLAQKVSG